MSVEPTLPLPVRVIEGLRTAESLRAEIAGLAAERDALRAEVDRTAWERDTAQSQAAYLREDVLHLDGSHAGEPRRIGLLLTAGDTPPPPPEDVSDQDIALVSLASGDLYVRPNRHIAEDWERFGRGTRVYRWSSSLIENGPFVSVCGPSLDSHTRAIERARELLSATAIKPHPDDWPASAVDIAQQLWNLDRWAPPHEWINSWRALACRTRNAWQDDALSFQRSVNDLASTWTAAADELDETSPDGERSEALRWCAGELRRVMDGIR